MQAPLDQWRDDVVRGRRIPAGVRSSLLRDPQSLIEVGGRTTVVRRTDAAPSPFLDAESRVFTDTAATTPASTGDTVRAWVTVNGDSLQAAASLASLQVVEGEFAVRCAALGKNVTTPQGTVAVTARPAAHDLLFSVSGNGVAEMQGNPSAFTSLLLSKPGESITLDVKLRGDGAGPDYVTNSFLETVRVWSPAAQTFEALAVGNASITFAGGPVSGWTWLRVTNTAGLVRFRVYAGGGTLLADQTVASAYPDAVLDTHPSGTMQLSLRVAAFGRVYRVQGAVLTDAQVAAIFRQAEYP